MIIQPFIILPFQRPLAAFTLYRLFLKIRTSFLPSFYLSAPAALQPRDGPAKKFFARQHRPNRQVGTRVLGAKTHCSEKRCVTLPLLSAACPWRVPKRISHILRFPRLGCKNALLRKTFRHVAIIPYFPPILNCPAGTIRRNPKNSAYMPSFPGSPTRYAYFPVLPKPPSPRWVAESACASSTGGRHTGSSTSWATRSPGWIS